MKETKRVGCFYVYNASWAMLQNTSSTVSGNFDVKQTAMLWRIKSKVVKRLTAIDASTKFTKILLFYIRKIVKHLYKNTGIFNKKDLFLDATVTISFKMCSSTDFNYARSFMYDNKWYQLYGRKNDDFRLINRQLLKSKQLQIKSW